MGAHQALAHRLEARTLLLGEVEEAELLAREDLRVLADQVLDLGPGLGVERVVGRAHVGELRVAALRRDRARVQDRVLRRDHLERAVGMPQPVADREQSPPVVPREDVVVLVEVGHVGEGRRQPVLVGSAQAGADRVLELTEAPAEGELLLVVELLIVEDEHGVLVHPGMDRLDVGGGERPREVDTVDFSGETGADLASRDGHRRQPPRNRLSPAAHTGGWLGTAESSERDASSSPGYHRDLARRERWGSSHAYSRRSTTAFRGTRRIPTDRARGREFRWCTTLMASRPTTRSTRTAWPLSATTSALTACSTCSRSQGQPRSPTAPISRPSTRIRTSSRRSTQPG